MSSSVCVCVQILSKYQLVHREINHFHSLTHFTGSQFHPHETYWTCKKNQMLDLKWVKRCRRHSDGVYLLNHENMKVFFHRPVLLEEGQVCHVSSQSRCGCEKLCSRVDFCEDWNSLRGLNDGQMQSVGSEGLCLSSLSHRETWRRSATTSSSLHLQLCPGTLNFC